MCVALIRSEILGIDRFTTDIGTPGGPVNLDIRQIGYGRHVFSLPVSMQYTNGNFSYTAIGCHVQWNGSTVTCVAPPGVGKSHRWTMDLFGQSGIQSPPGIVTNYKGPVLYDIISAENMTKTAKSAGGDVFNVTGANFGPISDNAVTWVKYAPFLSPAVQFVANCTLIEDHAVLQCITGEQAGSDQRWTIDVGNQVSEIPYTATQYPNVTRVEVLHVGNGLVVGADGVTRGSVDIFVAGGPKYAVPRNVSLGLSTMGGGIVNIYEKPHALPYLRGDATVVAKDVPKRKIFLSRPNENPKALSHSRLGGWYV